MKKRIIYMGVSLVALLLVGCNNSVTNNTGEGVSQNENMSSGEDGNTILSGGSTYGDYSSNINEEVYNPYLLKNEKFMKDDICYGERINEYDSEGNMLKHTEIRHWDNGEVDREKSEEYDSDGEIIVITEKHFNEDGTPKDYQIVKYIPNTDSFNDNYDNLFVSEKSITYDGDNEREYLSECSYNDDNQIVSYIRLMKDSSGRIIFGYKNYYEYTETGALSKIEEYEYDKRLNDYKLVKCDTYVYSGDKAEGFDFNGNKIDERYYEGPILVKSVECIDDLEYYKIYDSCGRIIENNSYMDNRSDSEWTIKYEYMGKGDSNYRKISTSDLGTIVEMNNFTVDNKTYVGYRECILNDNVDLTGYTDRAVRDLVNGRSGYCTVLDEDGELIESVEYIYDNNERHRLNYLEEDGNIVRKCESSIIYNSQGDIIKVEYEKNVDLEEVYDDLGRLIKVIDYYNGSILKQIEYEYDVSKKVETITTFIFDGGTEINEYNEDGDLIKTILVKEGMETGFTTYEYDNYHNVLKKTSYEDGKETSKIVYEYIEK